MTSELLQLREERGGLDFGFNLGLIGFHRILTGFYRIHSLMIRLGFRGVWWYDYTRRVYGFETSGLALPCEV